MAQLDSIQVKGLRELERRLKTLEPKLRERGLRGALFSGAKLIRDNARERVPEDTGFLKRNIIMYSPRRTAKRYAEEVHIGIRYKGAGGYKDKAKAVKQGKLRFRGTDQRGKLIPAYYWRFIEFGTSKKGARPFLRPAAYANFQGAVESARDRLRTNIEKFTR